MRMAVLADIHGNNGALEAVRTDLARRSPDVVVNLGDHLSGPLQAASTADLWEHDMELTRQETDSHVGLYREVVNLIRTGFFENAAQVSVTSL